MNADEIVATAQAQSGLDEFDSDSFLEPLEVLARGANRRAERDRLTEMFTPRLAAYLANRLRVADYLHQHPNLVDAPVDVGVVVMGMPRTGTTIISYLLDCDPRWRSLLNWEATNSVPPPTTATLRTDPRCVGAKKFQEQIFPQLGGNLPHWEWADGPTECIFVQS